MKTPAMFEGWRSRYEESLREFVTPVDVVFSFWVQTALGRQAVAHLSPSFPRIQMVGCSHPDSDEFLACIVVRAIEQDVMEVRS